MNRKTNLILALAAGLVGGLLSRYINPMPAFAQTQLVPKEIRAQSFVLVDEQGTAFGLMGFSPSSVFWMNGGERCGPRLRARHFCPE